MDTSNAESAALEATPIFTAYRRGYDPVQVDRYVADQQRRLDEALTRASEAERKLAAAVGQLRELHRRVAVLESEDRSPQPAPLDALGERVQRILQEAWEGAYALRQQAETEAAALRAEVAGEAAAAMADAEQRAAALVSAAERRAAAIDAEIERRRTAWNARLEEDRARAVAQIAHLHQQRVDAVGELLRLRAMIEKAVQDLGGAGQVAAEADTDASARLEEAHGDAAHAAAVRVASGVQESSELSGEPVTGGATTDGGGPGYAAPSSRDARGARRGAGMGTRRRRARRYRRAAAPPRAIRVPGASPAPARGQTESRGRRDRRGAGDHRAGEPAAGRPDQRLRLRGRAALVDPRAAGMGWPQLRPLRGGCPKAVDHGTAAGTAIAPNAQRDLPSTLRVREG